MEITCSMLDERLTAMHRAESALLSRGAATAEATSMAKRATALVHRSLSESSALQHHCSSLQEHIQELQRGVVNVGDVQDPAAASPAGASPPLPLRQSPLPPPPHPPQFGELWSHAAAADALALERLSGPRSTSAPPREQSLISELSKKSQQALHAHRHVYRHVQRVCTARASRVHCDV